MIEKFSDYETGYLATTGDFTFEITDYELADGKEWPCAKFTAKCSAGSTTIWHSLNPKARWSYNKLIKCCLNLKTAEQIENFECDYETIGNTLVGTKFKGTVTLDSYDKVVKVQNDDGTFSETTETRESYKITEYNFVA
jgi:hypothetical protein